MPNFSAASTNRLASCNHLLWDLFQEVVKEFDCAILCGFRGEADQNEAFDNGFSKLKWPDSFHNKQPSMAVDVAPCINGKAILNDRELLIHFGGYVRAVANQLKIALIWGGDWNENWIMSDQKFQDLYHFQLKT